MEAERELARSLCAATKRKKRGFDRRLLRGSSAAIFILGERGDGQLVDLGIEHQLETTDMTAVTRLDTWPDFDLAVADRFVAGRTLPGHRGAGSYHCRGRLGLSSDGLGSRRRVFASIIDPEALIVAQRLGRASVRQLAQRRFSRTGDDISIGLEPGAVAGTIPGAFGLIPPDQASHVRTDGRADGRRPVRRAIGRSG
jgi:hypothetical protein